MWKNNLSLGVNSVSFTLVQILMHRNQCFPSSNSSAFNNIIFNSIMLNTPVATLCDTDSS